jgi:hypothetical protein
VKTLRSLIDPFRGISRGRFDRYYGGVLRAGSGYPTADEARRDLRQRDGLATFYGWMR